jgi:parallel beta-helix repeat protein
MRFKAFIGMVLVLLFVGMLALAFNIHPVKASGTIYIRSDGSIYPSTANITTANNVTYYFTDDNYDEIVVERSNITIDGNGYTLQRSGWESGSGLSLHSVSNVTIRNTNIYGFGDGIYLNSASNNVISRNNITNNSDGIILEYSSNNSITENNITENNGYSGPAPWPNFGYGILFCYSSNNFLRNNTLIDNDLNFGVLGSTLYDFVNDVDVSNSVDGKPVYYWVNRSDAEVPSDAGYVVLVNCTNVNVENLTLTKNMQGILLAYTNYSTISENDVGNTWNGIMLSNSSKNIIRGNNLRANYGLGIGLTACSNNTISKNHVTATDYFGIYLLQSSNNTISGINVVTNSTIGIVLLDSSDNSLFRNNIANNFGGIGLGQFSTTNTVSGNNITENSEYGIWLDDSSNNIISGNNIAENNRYGVRLEDSSNNIISGNNITNNSWYGIWFGLSDNNAIYHNNFADNTQQVHSHISTNVWDDGYPSGGNYWSDHVCTGNPSDGSQPYIIDENNVDHYPFQDPNGWLLHQLTVNSSPITGITFTLNETPQSTPYTEWLSEGSFTLEMPETHAVDGAKYYWNQWSDGITSRTRTVTMNTNIALTAYYTGPHYQLTVTSSPITGIPFTINGVPQTTPYTEWLLEGSYTLIMPKTYNGYVWSHWLEDGDTSRIKTITLPGTTCTAVYILPPVGGTTVTIQSKPSLSWITPILLILSIAIATSIYRKHKKPAHK